MRKILGYDKNDERIHEGDFCSFKIPRGKLLKGKIVFNKKNLCYDFETQEHTFDFSSRYGFGSIECHKMKILKKYNE